MENKNLFLGLDIGGTKVEGAVAILNKEQFSLQLFSKKRITVDSKETIESFVDALAKLINDLLIEAGHTLQDLRAIGMGLPGSLDPQTSVMMNGNTRFLVGQDLIGLLKKKLRVDIAIFAQNDANLFALAEAWGGAGQKFALKKNIFFNEQTAIGITLGTGVGGGLVSKGEIYKGAYGAGLEVGHISLNPKGNACYCGQFGCAETYLSGTALNKFGDSREIFEKARAGDLKSQELLIIYRQHLVHFLSILNNLFNPHYFVFGGGLSAQDILFINLKIDLSKNVFLGANYCPELYINQLGDSSGLFGAMIYAQEILDH